MPDDPLDLEAARRIHVTNVGGAGMSAIATLLAEMGHPVTGHDPADDTPFLTSLRGLGAEITTGAPGPLPTADAVVVSTATPADHPHVLAAIAAGVPVVHRAAALAAICRQRTTVAVAGTHGKTTTSALLATLLTGAGLEPGYVVGAEVAGLGRNAAWGGTGPLVVEADESDGTFLELGAVSAVVTNVEPDHLEHWGGEAELRRAFERFVSALSGPAVLCADDPGALALAAHAAKPVTYGTALGADHRITDAVTEGTGVRFTLEHAGERLAVAVPAAPGLHNARNAAAAMAIAHTLGVPLAEAARALGGFRGVARRFEVRGEAAGVVLVDSYDHLPTEVAAALAAARAGDWGRVVCCFQPHRYSRTEALGRTFADCFSDADVLIVTGIYPAGEEPRPGVTGKIVSDAVLDAHPWKRVAWLPTLDDVVGYLGGTLRAGDLCLTLGAGDLTTVPGRVLDRLSARRPRHMSEPAVIEATADRLGELVERGAPLGALTTYRVGGAAALLARLDDERDLRAVADAVALTGVDVVVVGKGSNLLVADAGFPGLALVLGDSFATVDIDGTDVVAGAAAALPVVARRTVAAGLTGFEWAVGVPGSIGGAIRMNAGGHGSDMAAVLSRVRVVDLRSGEDGWVPASALDLGYRTSAVRPHHLVLAARLSLAAGSVERGSAQLAEIVAWRRANQPGGPNAGSVFTNPPGDSAGRLIDAAGGKGRRHGTAEVSAKHANFIQADEAGRAADVVALMGELQDLVRIHAGVELHPETRLVGFDADPRPEVEG